MIHREIALFFHPIGRVLVLANGRRSKNFLTFFQLTGKFSSDRDDVKQKNMINRCITLYLNLFHSLDPLQGLLEMASFPMVLV